MTTVLPLFDICSRNHHGNPQSVAANPGRSAKAADMARIMEQPWMPRTCDEVEQVTGLSHQTCSARFSDLKRAGLIEPTGEKRPTRTGRMAAVFRVTE